MRSEWAAAQLAVLFVNSKSNIKYTIYDFMPHEEEPCLTPEQVMARWK